MNLLLSLFLLAGPVSGREFSFNKSVDLDRLERNLIAAGFANPQTTCIGTRCVIRFADTEVKDPTLIIKAEPAPRTDAQKKATFSAMLAEIAAIEDKDDAGIPLTLAEQRRWRKIMRYMLFQLQRDIQ